jgi:hypothetical protein
MATPTDQRRRLMADGVVALLAALVWIFAALDLPPWFAAIPVACALVALVLLVSALRMRIRTEGGSAGTTGVTPELVVLALVGLAGLVVLVVRLVA